MKWGLDREAATPAFSELSNGSTLTPEQLFGQP
jgi:hypothetical protein